MTHDSETGNVRVADDSDTGHCPVDSTGSFKINSHRLVIELAQIEGGEGVLIGLASLAKRYAKLRNLSEIEWIVHAVSCAKPNLQLRRVLEHRGFAVKQLAAIGAAYHLVDSL